MLSAQLDFPPLRIIDNLLVLDYRLSIIDTFHNSLPLEVPICLTKISFTGVFRNTDKVAGVLAELHQAGLKTSEIAVLGNKTEQFKYLSGQIQDQTLKHFSDFGIGGCILGLIAGLAGAPHIPYGQSFQVIVPFMATISGGAAFAYFGCWMGAFLHANQPQHWASAFEGTVEGGDVIIIAEPATRQQRTQVMEILDRHNPSELIFRRKSWGQVEHQREIPAPVGQREAEERKLTSVA